MVPGISNNFMEKWKDVKRFKGYYQVSDHGNVKSVYRVIKGRHNISRIMSRILKPSVYRGGYGIVHLSKYCKVSHYSVHRLVLETFVGPCPKGLEACHNDGNPRNNHLSNLRFDTRSNNAKQRIEHGTQIMPFGEKAPGAKLKEKDIHYIRRNSKNQTHQRLANEFDVARSTISMIISRKAWRHI